MSSNFHTPTRTRRFMFSQTRQRSSGQALLQMLTTISWTSPSRNSKLSPYHFSVQNSKLPHETGHRSKMNLSLYSKRLRNLTISSWADRGLKYSPTTGISYLFSRLSYWNHSSGVMLFQNSNDGPSIFLVSIMSSSMWRERKTFSLTSSYNGRGAIEGTWRIKQLCAACYYRMQIHRPRTS